MLTAVLLMITVCTEAIASDGEDVLRPRGSAAERHANDGLRVSRSMILGIEGGANYSMFSQTMNRTGAALPDSPENVLKEGAGISPYFGLTADFLLAKSIGLQFRALYDAKNVSREFNSASDGTVDNSFQIINVPLVAKYTLDMNNITTALALRIDITKSVFITAGPMAQFTLGNVTRHDEVRIVNTDSNYFRINYDGIAGKYSSIERSINKVSKLLSGNQYVADSGVSYSSMRYGLEFGIGAKLDIGKNLWLVPQVRYQYMLTPLYNNFGAEDGVRMLTNQPSHIDFSDPKLHSLQFGAALWFGI